MILEFSACLPLILWIVFRVSLPPGPYEFDFDPQVRGTFISILPHYTKLFYRIAVVAMAGAIVGCYFVVGWPVLLFLIAATYAFLFNGLLIHSYERYLQARYPRDGNAPRSNYTLSRYALILSLAFSSILLLFVAAVWTARIVAWTR